MKKASFLQIPPSEDFTLEDVIEVSPKKITERIFDVFFVDKDHFLVVGKHGHLFIYDYQGELESELKVDLMHFSTEIIAVDISTDSQYLVISLANYNDEVSQLLLVKIDLDLKMKQVDSLTLKQGEEEDFDINSSMTCVKFLELEGIHVLVANQARGNHFIKTFYLNNDGKIEALPDGDMKGTFDQGYSSEVNQTFKNKVVIAGSSSLFNLVDCYIEG